MSKKHYRCHAHTNPFRNSGIMIPKAPGCMDWSVHFKDGKPPVNIDVGCGYGRFLFHLGGLFPDQNSCGFEIRDKVFEYVGLRTSEMDNCSVIKTNALLFLPNFFEKHSLERIFILFPDPHFKKRKQKGRIVCRQNIPVFKYLLATNGLLYVSTDVQELFDYMCHTIAESNLFHHAPELEHGEVFEKCYKDTDEAHRAGVKTGHTFCRIYRSL